MDDVLVVGAGLAGLTAAATAAREGLSTVMFESIGPGGQLLTAPRIENFPGFPGGIPGHDLATSSLEQASDAGAKLEFADVTGIARGEDGDSWKVETSAGQFYGRTLIIATGSSLRRLGVPGEDRLNGRGVTYCGSCDGWLFKGKRMVVVGGGDSALEETMHLADIVEEIVLVHDGPTLTGSRSTQERVRALPNVHIRPRSRIVAINGEEQVDSVRIVDDATSEESDLATSGVAIYVGFSPRSELIAHLITPDPSGQVPANQAMATEQPGIYVAGDVRAGSLRTLVDCAADGARAAVSAAAYVGGATRP